MNILVLHGPDLTLLDSLDQVNASIKTRANGLDIAVKVFQSNHEGALLDTLHAERQWANGIVINPGALAHTSYVLREAIAAVNKPTIEIHLTDIRRRESWRRKSVLKDVCQGQVLGKGLDSYAIALERFASGDLAGRKRTARPMRAGTTVQPAPAPAPVPKKPLGRVTPVAENGARPTKTLGRKQVEAAPPPAKLEKTLGRGDNKIITRASVRQKIAERLAGKLTPAGLATWARAQWLEVQRGAPAESGQRELLEDSLQTLTLSAMPASKLSEDQLVELMTQLEG